jgi:flagellar hook-basal body complex protein FliE
MADIKIDDIRRQLDDINLKSRVNNNNDDGEQFSSVLEKIINKVDNDYKESDKAIQNFVSGKDTNLHSTLISLEKADVSFQLMMKVRGKLMEAYHEIMRTQV